MTWEIFLGIAALAAFLVGVVTPIVKLTNTITKLSGSVDRLDACCPGTSSNIKEYPTLWEFVHTVPIPGVYCECDFHDVPSVAEFIITHQKEIGESIARGLCDYYNVVW